MTRFQANHLLDGVRAGYLQPDAEEITEALRATGDIPAPNSAWRIGQAERDDVERALQ